MESFIKTFLRKIRPVIAPKSSRAEYITRLLLQRLPALLSMLLRPYKAWIAKNELDALGLNGECPVTDFLLQPLISLVVPIYYGSSKALVQTIESVLSQTYKNWEICIAAGASMDQELAVILDDFAHSDARISIINFGKELMVSEITNAVISNARGEFIAFLDQNDLLAPSAIFDLISAINQFPESDMLYSDEDYVTEDGKCRYGPCFKPVLAVDYLRAFNYMPRFFVIRKDVGDRLGWLREGLDNAQDFDLILRVVEVARWVTHIPQVLYHQRALSISVVRVWGTDEHSDEGDVVVRDHLRRVGLNGRVESGPEKFTYRVRYELIGHPLISIIIPSHELASELRRCVKSILEKTTYQSFEILLVENNSEGSEIFETYRDLQALNTRVRLLEYHHTPFNFAEINNVAASKALGEVLLFLNNDTEIISPDWLERMLEYAQRPDVGAVGAKMYYPQGLLQHVGMIIGMP